MGILDHENNFTRSTYLILMTTTFTLKTYTSTFPLTCTHLHAQTHIHMHTPTHIQDQVDVVYAAVDNILPGLQEMTQHLVRVLQQLGRASPVRPVVGHILAHWCLRLLTEKNDGGWVEDQGYLTQECGSSLQEKAC